LNQFRKTTIFIILLTLFAPQTACSEDRTGRQNHKWLYEIRTGILAHDVPIWSLSREEGGVDFNAEFIFAYPDYSLISGILRTNLGFSLNSRGDTSKIYSGLLWEYIWNSVIFMDLGLGLAVHDGKLDNNDDRKELGSRILFRIPIEIGFLFAGHHGISIMFDHVSNAYLADPNEGLDTLGLRYSYRF
jgi:lipid A 3-O-deacylase